MPTLSVRQSCREFQLFHHLLRDSVPEIRNEQAPYWQRLVLCIQPLLYRNGTTHRSEIHPDLQRQALPYR